MRKYMAIVFFTIFIVITVLLLLDLEKPVTTREKLVTPTEKQTRSEQVLKKARAHYDKEAKKGVRKYWTDPVTISLCDAIVDEDIDEVKRLISSGADVNQVGKNGATPLFLAVSNKKRESYQLLLQENADPNLPKSDLNSEYFGYLNPIHVAARIDDDSTWLELAMKHGGDPNSLGKNSKDEECGPYPVIFSAIQSCYSYDNFAVLVDAGADIHLKDPCGRTPFLIAVESGKFEIANKLLELGSDWNVVGEWGQDAAFLCFIEPVADKFAFPYKYISHLELLVNLKSKGANLNAAYQKATDHFGKRDRDKISDFLTVEAVEDFIEKQKQYTN